MIALRLLVLVSVAAGCGATSRAPTSPRVQAQVVRVAEIEVDPAQLASYVAIVTEEMAESIRIEPGVLAIYAVAHKDQPTKFTFFEMYVDEAAYLSHRESPHFKKYVEGTKAMILTRKLVETVPLQLSAKPH